MKPKGKKALLVGINKYDDSKLSNLRFSANDVSSLYSILTDPKRGGFASDNCLLMTDRIRKRNRKPIRSNLMSSIRSLSQTAKPDDYILFFFSGHGIEEKEKSYLLPSDARINVLRDTALSIDWIKTTLEASKAQAKVLILDACHAGAMKGKSESGRMTKGLHDSLFPATEGFAILSSCKLHEVSYEMPEKKHSVFSYFLIEGLEGAADFDTDGRVSVSDVSRYTAERTMNWSYKENVQQTPNLEYKVVGDLMLVSVPRLEDKKVQVTKIEEVEQDLSDLALNIISIDMFSFVPKDNREKEVDRIANVFCPYLLKHFSLQEIEYDMKTGGYVFPLGTLHGNYAALTLNYDPQESERIEEILVKGASLIHPDTLVYKFSSSFDLRKISKLLTTRKWKPTKYDPKLLREDEKRMGRKSFLELLAKLPELEQELKLMFFQSDGNDNLATIIVTDSTGKKLDEKSMQVLRPKSFLKLLGDIWKRK